MKRQCLTGIKSVLFVMGLLLCFSSAASALVDFSEAKNSLIASALDLRRYFEKAMDLFESGRYKEAIVVFENLIEIEKSQNDFYFTPFAEVYIDKSRSRMKDLMMLEDRKWTAMKKGVISEEERIAKERARDIALMRKDGIEGQDIKKIYEESLDYYGKKDYPSAIVGFKKVKEMDEEGNLGSKSGSFIERARNDIKRQQEKELLAKMESARLGKMEIDKEEMALRIQRERMEIEKARLKKIFEQRLRDTLAKEKRIRIENLLSEIRGYVNMEELDRAYEALSRAMEEFPDNERFKDILHYVDMEKIKIQEKALAREREIIEEKMLLEVAEKHLMPEMKESVLKKDKKITPIVKVPEIRKKLRIPISIDFKDVALDYVLSFLSDATGVNIIPSTQIDMNEKKVSIKIKDMPLEDALEYILKSQNLIYRIEEDAVWIASKEEMDNESIETRVYFLNEGIGRFSEMTGVASEDASASTNSEVKTVKNILENAVDWPKDSKLMLDNRTGALIISNTPTNLETIENLLYTIDITPVQVLIEARFLEVKVTDIDELGIEWKLNSDWGVTQNNSKGNVHGFASGSGVDFSDFTNADEGFNLTYQGILSHPQFQAVLHALQKKQDVKTLSAPRITTLNNQMATIKVIDEYIYPTRYEVSLVQYDINGDGDFDDAGESEWANIPQDFVTRDVGILLHVKPSVGVDNKTITLALTPEVSEDAGSYSYSGDVVIPQFKTRNLSTSVLLGSGDTIVMGGLIKETNTTVKTKVPLLGDIPVLGNLFKKSTDNTERRNLVIFVTATIMDNGNNIVAGIPEDINNKRKQ